MCVCVFGVCVCSGVVGWGYVCLGVLDKTAVIYQFISVFHIRHLNAELVLISNSWHFREK